MTEYCLVGMSHATKAYHASGGSEADKLWKAFKAYAEHSFGPAPEPVGQIIQAGELRLDQARCVASVCGQAVPLTRKEYELLRVLMLRPCRAITKRELLLEVWGPPQADMDEYLRVCLGNLRKKLRAAGMRQEHIHTEIGRGYRFEAPEKNLGAA